MTPFGDEACSSLKILAYGAAPMPVIRQAIAMFPPTVGFINAFGQTETTATVTMLLPEDHRLRALHQRLSASFNGWPGDRYRMSRCASSIPRGPKWRRVRSAKSWCARLAS